MEEKHQTLTKGVRFDTPKGTRCTVVSDDHNSDPIRYSDRARAAHLSHEVHKLIEAALQRFNAVHGAKDAEDLWITISFTSFETTVEVNDRFAH